MFISQGAEAVIERQDDKVLKRRLPKTYRLTVLDNSLRVSRTKREQKVLRKAKELGVSVPELFESPDNTTICMEFIEGRRLRDLLLEDSSQGKLLVQVGKWLARLHDASIIHGDLTTSNIIVTNKKKLYLIDFGLSFFSTRCEDKAVDLHLLEQALESTHYKDASSFFDYFLQGYTSGHDGFDVLARLEKVRLRGRNKQY